MLAAVRQDELVHLRLDGHALDAGVVQRRSTWISLSKCPMLQTIAWSFILSMCSRVMTSQLPVAVT